jgi:hypothetical protein
MAPTEKLQVNEQEGNDFVLKAGDLVKIAGYTFEILDAPLPSSLVAAAHDLPPLDDTTDSSLDILQPSQTIGSPEAQSQQIHRAEPATVTVENVLLNIMPDLKPMDIATDPSLPKAASSSPSIEAPIDEPVPPRQAAIKIQEPAVSLETPRPPEAHRAEAAEPVISLTPPTILRGDPHKFAWVKSTALAASLFTAMIGSIYFLKHRIVPTTSPVEVTETYSTGKQANSAASIADHIRQPASKPANPAPDPTIQEFFTAVKGGDLKTMQTMLVFKEIDPNTSRLNGRTALMEAARYGQTKVAKYLLSKKVNLNTQDPKGDTALMYATRENRLEIAKLLVDKGASRTTHAVDGDTPLQVAVRENHVELAQLLRIKTKAKTKTKHSRRPASNPRLEWH